MRTLLVALLALHAAVAAPLLDESFDGAAPPAGWRFAAARGACAGRWDEENAFGTGRSLRLAIPEDGTARAHWRYEPKIPLKPNRTYRLSLRILALNVTGEAYAILYENGLEVPDRWHQTRRTSGSHDWEGHGLSFRTGADASWGRLVLKLRHGTGYAWFDSVTLEETEQMLEPDGDARQFPADDGFALQAMWTPAQWTQRGVLHAARGQLNPLSLFFRGRQAELDGPALCIGTSPGLILVGPLVPGRGPVADAAHAAATGTNRWRIPVPADVLKRARLDDRYRWERYFHLGLDAAADAPATGTFSWWFENAGQTGPKHELTVRTAELGESLAPAPDFAILVQHTGILRSPELEFNRRMLRYLQLGAVEGGLGPSHYDPVLKATDEALARAGFRSHSWKFEAFDAPAGAGPRAVDQKGRALPHKICPSAQISLPSWEEHLRAYYRGRLTDGISRLIIDYEPPASSLCFCPVCRRAFAEHAKLEATAVLAMSGDDLRKGHAPAWGRFCAERHGEIVRRHIRIIRETAPGAEVGLCSWPCTAAVAADGGDIRQFEPDATCHMPMIYSKGTNYHDRVAETCARTGIPVLPFVELSDISQPRHLTPDEFAQNLLATAFSGGGGAVLWVGAECLDAEYMGRLRDSLRAVRDLRRQVPWRREPVPWLDARPARKLQRTIQVDGKPVGHRAERGASLSASARLGRRPEGGRRRAQLRSRAGPRRGGLPRRRAAGHRLRAGRGHGDAHRGPAVEPHPASLARRGWVGMFPPAHHERSRSVRCNLPCSM